MTTPATLATVGWLGFVTLTVAYMLIGLGLARHPLRIVGAVTLLEPAVAAVLAVTVVREPATVGLWIGLLLVVSGVAVAGFIRVGVSHSRSSS